ncbi:Cro/CI family transcriptional regulator [Pantoea agglomerans]|uniref:Cro/CI family transcriptional regulator n=1 Tax=Enterobacter agglomerans TaxID=549 RepID=UPI0023AF0018|nr:Cro/CI family transcriptional regulator [Pantoea agglomerans]WEC71198.1 Cro/CI family transcriptional regulator [Pantoea agglomerans]
MNKSEVLSYYGGVTATARYLNIAKSSVSGWSDPIPWKFALLLSEVTNNKLKFVSSDYPELVPLFELQPGVEQRG